MTTLILLRHGRSSANARACWPGAPRASSSTRPGRAQAQKVVERLAGRAARGDRLLAGCCAASRPSRRSPRTAAWCRSTEPELAEVDYGSWTGGALKKLAKEPLWRVVQAHPSAAVFPDGEGLAGMQARAVAAVRAGTTPGSPPSTGRARCGWPAATAT